MIDLRVLGTLDLRDPAVGTPIAAVLAQPKRTALLVYLAAAVPRGAHRRDQLLLLFWPNSTDERARNSLSQAVFNLRRSLGDAAVVGSGDVLRVNADLIRCDAVQFEEALANGERERALSLYGGELLPGFHLDECIDFERWLDGERQRLRSKAIEVALELSGNEQRSGNGVAAVELLRRVVSWAPYDEPAVVRLIRLLADLGDRPGALREYDRFRTLLNSELSVSPSRELEALAEQIRAPAPPVAAQGRNTRNMPAGAVPAAAPADSVAEAVVPKTRWRTRNVAAGGSIVLAAAVVVFAAGRMASSAAADASPPLDPHRVLVAAFENRTGDPALEPVTYMAADWIAQGLARSGIARVVPFSTVVQETPYLTGSDSAAEPGVPAANRLFARGAGAGLLLGGSYYRAGDSLVLQAQVIDVRTGELLRAIDEVRGAVGSPTVAIEELQRRSVGAMAILLDARLESWPDPGSQPSNLEAYRLFSDGMSAFMHAMDSFGTPERVPQFAAAASRFEAAASADTAFSLPLLWAAYAHINASHPEAAWSIVRALDEKPLSAWNRAVLDHIAATLRRDFEAMYQTARRLVDLSPDSEWLSKLARGAFLTGRHREALAAYVKMDPSRGWLKGWGGYWRLRAEVQHVLGDHPAALEDARRGLVAQPDDGWLRTQELWALAAAGRGDDLVQAISPQLAAGGVFALWQLNTVMEELRGHGHVRTATRVFQQLLPVAEKVAARDGGVRARAELARMLCLAGRDQQASDIYAELVSQRAGDAEVRVRSALLAARRGDPRPARETLRWLATLTADDVTRTFPRPQLGYWGSAEGWLALLQARLLTQLGETQSAVEMLRKAGQEGLTHTYLHLHDDPDFDRLRRLGEFQRFLRPRG